MKTHSCINEEQKDLYRTTAINFSIIESVMAESKLFYKGLYESDNMTQEIYTHFNNVRKIADKHEQYNPLVEKMVKDAQDFMEFSRCLDA